MKSMENDDSSTVTPDHEVIEREQPQMKSVDKDDNQTHPPDPEGIERENRGIASPKIEKDEHIKKADHYGKYDQKVREKMNFKGTQPKVYILDNQFNYRL